MYILTTTTGLAALVFAAQATSAEYRAVPLPLNVRAISASHSGSIFGVDAAFDHVAPLQFNEVTAESTGTYAITSAWQGFRIADTGAILLSTGTTGNAQIGMLRGHDEFHPFAISEEESVFTGVMTISSDGRHAAAPVVSDANVVSAVVWHDGARKAYNSVFPVAVNSAGDVAGWVPNSDSWPEPRIPARTSNGIAQTLVLPKAADGFARSAEHAHLSDRGDTYIVIEDYNSSTQLRSISTLLYKRGESNSAQLEIGSLDAVFSEVLDTNAVGQAVGFVEGETSSLAALWNGTRYTNINDLVDKRDGWTYTRAYSINDAGTILAYGQRDDEGRTFALYASNVVPEPSLAGLVAAAICCWPRRRNAIAPPWSPLKDPAAIWALSVD